MSFFKFYEKFVSKTFAGFCFFVFLWQKVTVFQFLPLGKRANLKTEVTRKQGMPNERVRVRVLEMFVVR